MHRSFAVAITPKIVVADVDDPVLQVALDIEAGTLTAPTNALVTATGNGTAHVQLTGPTAALNTVLAGLSLYLAPAAPGTEHLQVHVTDFAASGGSPATTAATLLVTVTNQAPTTTGTAPKFSMSANSTLSVAAPGLLSAFQDSDGDALQVHACDRSKRFRHAGWFTRTGLSPIRRPRRHGAVLGRGDGYPAQQSAGFGST